MKRIIFVLPILFCLALFACAPVTMLNTITPSSGYAKASDIAFGDHERLKLDVYRPDNASDNQPVVIFVHGGSWSSGNKDMYKFMGDALTAEGFTTVIPNYRLHPGILFPDPVEDTAKAIAWTVREFGDRPIVVMGHSAGAYNILMAVMDEQFLAGKAVSTCDHIAGVVSLAGPVGIVPLKEEPYITIFPDRFTGADAPLNNVNGPLPPMFLINGDKDKSVYPQNAEQLAAKITDFGGDAQAQIYPGMNHTDPVKFFSRYFDGDSTLKADIVKFIRFHAGPKESGYCR